MSQRLKLEIKAMNAIAGEDLVVLVSDKLIPAPAAEEWLGEGGRSLIARAAAAERFKGKALSGLTILAPEGAGYERLILVGVGPEGERDKLDFALLGGAIAGRLGHGRSADIIAALPGGEFSATEIAEIGLGLRLRCYAFNQYKTKSRDAEQGEAKTAILRVADSSAVKKALKAREAIAGGVELARDLVNEPPNVLYPEEFAERAARLEKLGVEVEILDEKQLKKIGMRALLGVGQGSRRESRVVVMRWNGAGKGEQPVALPATKSRSASSSLFENRPAFSCASATRIAPVSVARLTMKSGLKRSCVYQSTSARTSRPSASVLMISMVWPESDVTMSPGR